MLLQRGDFTDKTFDEAIAGVRKAERGVEVREDLAQGFEYVKQYAEEVINRQAEAVQSAKTAASAASAATAQARTAASAASAAAASQTASGQSAAAAKASADAAAKSAKDAAAAASTDTTLSVSGAPADAKAVGDRLADVYSKAEIDALLKGVNPFPVGSIYQSTDATSPAALFGGTWEQIASERVLMGASSTHAAGTTAKAGLPNITGSFPTTTYGSNYNKTSGAFSLGSRITGNGEDSNSSFNSYYVSFAASGSNAIYGRSSTVQPAAYYVHIWRRTA